MNNLAKYKSLILTTLKVSYCAVIGVFFLDIFTYYGFVQNNIFSPLLIASFVLLIHFLVRIFTHIRLSRNFVLINLFLIAPISLLLSYLVYYFEEFGLLFPNYFFSNFRLHYHALPLLFFPTIGFALVHAGRDFWEQYWRKVVFLLSVLLSIAAIFLFYFDNDAYRTLTREDGMVENVTALAFLAAGILSFRITKIDPVFQKKTEQKLFSIGMLIVGILFVVVAGEEISWGQRIFNIETPEMIAASNRQGEINIHNSEAFWPYVYTAYALIGLYGMLLWIFSWLLSDIAPTNHSFITWQKLLIPSGYFVVLFGAITLYVWLKEIHGPWKYQPWEEFSELLLAFGILAHIIDVHTNLQQEPHRLKKKR